MKKVKGDSDTMKIKGYSNITKYKVKNYSDNKFKVVQINIISGERINAYESEPDTVSEIDIYHGDLSNCYAFIKLKEQNYM